MTSGPGRPGRRVEPARDSQFGLADAPDDPAFGWASSRRS